MREILTAKQERFALYIFEGMLQREAYIKAGYSSNMLPATVDHNAAILVKNSKIVTRLAELKTKATSKSVMTVQERKERLTTFAKENIYNKSTPVRSGNISAIAELNKMENVYIEHQTTVNVDNRKIEIIVQSENTKQLLSEIVQGVNPHDPARLEPAVNTNNNE